MTDSAAKNDDQYAPPRRFRYIHPVDLLTGCLQGALEASSQLVEVTHDCYTTYSETINGRSMLSYKLRERAYCDPHDRFYPEAYRSLERAKKCAVGVSEWLRWGMAARAGTFETELRAVLTDLHSYALNFPGIALYPGLRDACARWSERLAKGWELLEELRSVAVESRDPIEWNDTLRVALKAMVALDDAFSAYYEAAQGAAVDLTLQFDAVVDAMVPVEDQLARIGPRLSHVYEDRSDVLSLIEQLPNGLTQCRGQLGMWQRQPVSLEEDATVQRKRLRSILAWGWDPTVQLGNLVFALMELLPTGVASPKTNPDDRPDGVESEARRRAETRSGGNLLSSREINTGFIIIEEILTELHYAIWIEIEYQGQPPDRRIDIVRRPEEAFDADVTKYLAEHPDFWVSKRLKCPRCGELPWQDKLTVCPTVRSLGRGDPPHIVRCGEPLEEISEVPPEEFRRKKAASEILLNDTPVSREHLVCRWIVIHMTGNDWTPQGTTLFLALSELRAKLGEMLAGCVDRLNSHIHFRDPVRLLGRRDLYPRGDNIAAKHADYLSTRDKLISCYHWLAGQTTGHPEFIERGEASHGVADFYAPVQLPIENRRVLDIPIWDSDRRELTFRGKVCKSYRKSPAPNQTSILDAFQAANWPRRLGMVSDPDGEPLTHRRLLETIRGLKRSLKYVTFGAVGTGTGITWELATNRTKRRTSATTHK